MEPPDRTTALRVEKLRLSWEFASKQLEMRERRLIQLLATALTAGATAVVSVAVERVPVVPGMAVACASATGAFYAYARLRTLPRQMRRVVNVLHARFETLIRSPEE